VLKQSSALTIDVSYLPGWSPGWRFILCGKVLKVARYLKHLDIEHEAPAKAPPRYQEESFEFSAI
jgi:hypothetical protein